MKKANSCWQLRSWMVLTLVLLLMSSPARATDEEVDGNCQFDTGWQITPQTGNSPNGKFSFGLMSVQFVFVAGFLNEVFANYYQDNILELNKQFGIQGDQVQIIRPSSRASVESNATWLRQEILAIHRRNPAPIILVAHSKGAAESLTMLMAYPDLLNDSVILDFVSVQGAIFGSPIADIYSTLPESSPSPELSLLNWLWESIGYRLRVFDNWLTDQVFAEGVNSLETQAARNRFNSLLVKLDPIYREELSARVHYVISHVKPQDASLLTRLPGLYLRVFGPNDGVLLLENQYSRDLGQVLAHYYADHTDLVLGRSASRLSKKCITNFTTDLIHRMSQH